VPVNICCHSYCSATIDRYTAVCYSNRAVMYPCFSNMAPTIIYISYTSQITITLSLFTFHYSELGGQAAIKLFFFVFLIIKTHFLSLQYFSIWHTCWVEFGLKTTTLSPLKCKLSYSTHGIYYNLLASPQPVSIVRHQICNISDHVVPNYTLEMW